MDFFKQVNDIHGHAAGDLVLCYAAQTIKSVVRNSDYVARLGGDEFAVIVENCFQAKTALVIAEAIIERLSAPIAVADDTYVTVGASIGIALHNYYCQTSEQLLDYADKALYQVKESGRNGVRFYNGE